MTLIVDRDYKKIEEWINNVGKDDMNAFEDLYHFTERALYAFSLSLCKNEDDALDLMHDTYMKIRSAAHLYKPMGKPLAWIFTIAKNLFFTNSNREKRVVLMENDEIKESNDDYVDENPDDKLVVKEALEILSTDDAAIVLLFAVDGYKHREIAEIMGMTQNTVISKYNRSLKKLKKHLKEVMKYER